MYAGVCKLGEASFICATPSWSNYPILAKYLDTHRLKDGINEVRFDVSLEARRKPISTKVYSSIYLETGNWRPGVHEEMISFVSRFG